jgi:septum formation protein
MKKIILASTSPRRKELLENIELEFDVVGSDYVEDMTLDMEPSELAKFLSLGKAEDVAKKYKKQNCIIIAADTFVTINSHKLGKPHTSKVARQTLNMISGQTIKVITGYTVIETSSQKTISQSVTTQVIIKNLNESEIESYIKTGEPLDKAGAFGIQGKGTLLIKEIHGDYSNIVGLPIYSLSQSLKKFNINLL